MINYLKFLPVLFIIVQFSLAADLDYDSTVAGAWQIYGNSLAYNDNPNSFIRCTRGYILDEPWRLTHYDLNKFDFDGYLGKTLIRINAYNRKAVVSYHRYPCWYHDKLGVSRIGLNRYSNGDTLDYIYQYWDPEFQKQAGALCSTLANYIYAHPLRQMVSGIRCMTFALSLENFDDYVLLKNDKSKPWSASNQHLSSTGIANIDSGTKWLDAPRILTNANKNDHFWKVNTYHQTAFDTTRFPRKKFATVVKECGLGSSQTMAMELIKRGFGFFSTDGCAQQAIAQKFGPWDSWGRRTAYTTYVKTGVTYAHMEPRGCSRPSDIYWTLLGYLHYGIEIGSIYGGDMENIGKTNNFDKSSYLFCNKYAGQNNAAKANGGFCALRRGIDVWDTVSFPAATYGALAWDGSATRVSKIFSYCSTAFQPYPPKTKTNTDGSDVSIGIEKGNYDYLITQIDPESTSLPGWHLKDTDNDGRYGFFVRRTMSDRGKPKMYFNINDQLGQALNSKSMIYIKVIYFDSGNPTDDSWQILYNSKSALQNNSCIVNVANTKKWKDTTFEITDANFSNSGEKQSDIMIFNSSGADQYFHMLEVTFYKGYSTADSGSYVNVGVIESPENKAAIPEKTIQSYPNPFNPACAIKYAVSPAGPTSLVQLSIYNLRGQLVRTLVKEEQGMGNYSVVWDGKDDCNKGAVSGIYYAVLKTPDYTKSKKLVMIK